MTAPGSAAAARRARAAAGSARGMPGAAIPVRAQRSTAPAGSISYRMPVLSAVRAADVLFSAVPISFSLFLCFSFLPFPPLPVLSFFFLSLLPCFG